MTNEASILLRRQAYYRSIFAQRDHRSLWECIDEAVRVFESRTPRPEREIEPKPGPIGRPIATAVEGART
jgi:hypothetical protein